MSQREKTLAIIVGVILALVLNFVLVKFFISKHAEFTKRLASADSGIAFLQKQESERALWKERDEWLDSSMADAGDVQVENRQIIERLREVAKMHTVTLEAPNPGVLSKQPNHTSLPVRVEGRAEWKNMFDFLNEIQGPDKFMVFESLDLRVDPADKTKLRASMTIAKWFRPSQRAL